MSVIFISYRRADSAPYAGRLFDNLTAHFGADQIFMDIDTIKPGADFAEVIEKTVGSCDALVAVIGKQWLSATDSDGKRRLDNPDDFVSLEIAAALNQNIRVIPILVDGAKLPQVGQLPSSLTNLLRYNALEVSNERFQYDIKKLISALTAFVKIQVPRIQLTKLSTTNWARFSVYIDDRRVGHIFNGQEKTFEVLLGKHTIYAATEFLPLAQIPLKSQVHKFELPFSGVIRFSCQWAGLLKYAIDLSLQES